MISPTGLGIRNDSEGLGHYNSIRHGGRQHKGTDYLAVAFQDIIAPFDMILKRYANPTMKFPRESGVEWITPFASGKMFYFIPKPELIGSFVIKSHVIGTAIDLKPYYGENIKSHIHFQIDSIDPELFRSLSNVLKKYQMI